LNHIGGGNLLSRDKAVRFICGYFYSCCEKSNSIRAAGFLSMLENPDLSDVFHSARSVLVQWWLRVVVVRFGWGTVCGGILWGLKSVCTHG
jgi:hypothetical protein